MLCRDRKLRSFVILGADFNNPESIKEILANQIECLVVYSKRKIILPNRQLRDVPGLAPNQTVSKLRAKA